MTSAKTRACRASRGFARSRNRAGQKRYCVTGSDTEIRAFTGKKADRKKVPRKKENPKRSLCVTVPTSLSLFSPPMPLSLSRGGSGRGFASTRDSPSVSPKREILGEKTLVSRQRLSRGERLRSPLAAGDLSLLGRETSGLYHRRASSGRRKRGNSARSGGEAVAGSRARAHHAFTIRLPDTPFTGPL